MFSVKITDPVYKSWKTPKCTKSCCYRLVQWSTYVWLLWTKLSNFGHLLWQWTMPVHAQWDGRR